MDKGNRHPYQGLTVYFGTKHGKEEVIAPLLFSIGLGCETVPIDTDQFGTFSGEVERKGSVRETLRLKTEAVFCEKPEARLALASEGSFMPHPLIGILPSNHEALLLVDRELSIEIFVDVLSKETNHAEIEFSPKDDLDSFLRSIYFPAHAVIVRADKKSPCIAKGIQDQRKLYQAILDAFMASKNGKAVLSTDMRAHLNPSRMKVIQSAGEKLISRIDSLCPDCRVPGFGPIRGIRGLICSDCGAETQGIKQVLWACAKCNHEQIRLRDDNVRLADPGECDYCNP